MLGTNVADVIIDVLKGFGVRHVYGVPGDAINQLVAAVGRTSDLDFVHVRHEETGAFAASAHGKLTGEVGVCFGTAGPGGVHLLNGLYDAKADHAPVLAITGQVATTFLGTQYHQEVDLQQLFDGVTVFNQRVVNPDQLPGLLIQAVHEAVSRGGVAHLSLPEDIAGASTKRHESAPATFKTRRPRCLPREEDLDSAASVLNEATKVTILAGVGVLAAKDELLRVAQRLQAPIIRTLPAKELIPDEHLHSVGHLGELGGEPAVDAINDCDALLMVGTDFPYYEYLPRKKPTVQIDSDPARIGRRQPVAAALTGDAREALPLLEERLSPRDGEFLEQSHRAMMDWINDQKQLEYRTASPIHPQTVTANVAAHARDDAIFTCDTGAVTVWAARNLRMREGQRFTLSGNLASMAYGMPAAIAAARAFPDRQVIALVGDGGFTMLMAELLTIVDEALPIKVIVYNNRKLGLIKLEQEAAGLAETHTALRDLDFAAFAVNCGATGFRIDDSSQVDETVREALSAPGPCLIDAVIEADELIIPPKIEVKDAVNFSVGRLKTLFRH